MEKWEYKMDRRELRSMTLEEADDHTSYWKSKSPMERLDAACFIINQIFGTTFLTKVDVAITSKRKHSDV